MTTGMSLVGRFTWCQITLSFIASIATAVLFGWVLVPKLIAYEIIKGAVISPDINPDLYSAWTKPQIPIYLKVYLFNCTNPAEVEKGMLPAVQEIGPYVFQQKREKVNVTLDDVSDTATYSEHVRYYFRKDLSGCQSLEDVLTIINVPYAGAAIAIDRDLPWPMSHIGHTILLNYKEPLFINRTVEEILFKGWKVPFMQKVEEEIGLTLRENNTFAYLTGLNDTIQGPYTVIRGRYDRSLFGSLVKYKNKNTLSFWGDKDSYCNQIYGTDGTIYPPFIEKDAKLKLFNAEVCRSLFLTFNADANFEGIHGYRFTVPNNLSEEILEEEKCFCQEYDRTKCLKMGAADMSPCRNGDPVAMSGPYFIGDLVHPDHLETIEGGWKPEKAKHETFIDVEPITGTVMQVSKKLQVGLILKKVKSIKSLRKVKDNLFPLFWADECAWLDANSTDSLKTALFKIHAANYGSKCAAILLAAFVPVLIIIISNLRKTKERRLKKKPTTSATVGKIEQMGSTPLINET